MQQRQMAKAKAEFDKAAAANKAKSDAFLAQNKAKAGVKTLPGGVQYRVVATGNGAKPTQAREVSINYNRKLASRGQTFVDTFSTPDCHKPPSRSINIHPNPPWDPRDASNTSTN